MTMVGMRHGSSLRALALAALVAVSAGSASTASAEDKSGTLGVGVDTSLGWAAAQNVDSTQPDFGFRVPGLALTYDVSAGFGLELIAGVLMRKDDATDTRVTQYAMALRGLFRMEVQQQVHLDLVLGFGMAGARVKPDVGDSFVGRIFTIEVGFRPQYFVTPDLSLHTQIGFAIAIFSDDDSLIGPGPDGALGVDIFGNVNLLGNAGFTYWF